MYTLRRSTKILLAITRRMTHQSHGIFYNRNIDADSDPMYWLMPAGAAIGILVVVLFNYWTQGDSKKACSR